MNQACILCEGETSTLYLPHMKAHYHACSRCEFISKDPVFHITKAEELAIYNHHQNSIEDPRYVAYFHGFLKEAVFPFVGKGRSGLDFGSGPSPVLASLLERDHGYRMDIYDPFFAPEKTYTGQRYDLITCTEVAEHLSDPLPTFRLFRELLKHGGIVAVMTQFHRNDPAHFTHWHYVRDKSHISFYTPTTMHQIAEKTGLRVIHINRERTATFARTE